MTSVLDYSRDELCERLRQLLGGKDLSTAYLIGSCARGTAGAWSDVDVVLVLETTMPFIERPKLFPELWELGVAIDVLVHTPEEFERMEASPTPFWKDSLKGRIRLL